MKKEEGSLEVILTGKHKKEKENDRRQESLSKEEAKEKSLNKKKYLYWINIENQGNALKTEKTQSFGASF